MGNISRRRSQELNRGKKRKPARERCCDRRCIHFPENAFISYYFSLTTRCSNNATEYEVDITKLEQELQIPIANMTITKILS